MSRFRSVIVATIIGALSVAGGVFLLTCSDRGTNPVPPPPPEPPKDYPVYFFKAQSGQLGTLFRFRVVSHELDSASIQINLRYQGLRVSADGTLLYLYDGIQHRIFDAATLLEIDTLHQRGVITVSPDGRYLSLTDSVHVLLRADDYSVVAVDSIRPLLIRYSWDGRYLFMLLHDGTDYWVRRIQLATMAIDAEINVDPVGVRTFEPSPDGSFLFFYRQYAPYFCAVELYGVGSGAFIDGSVIEYGRGAMCVNPVTNHLYYTAPGDYGIWYYGTVSLARWRLGDEGTGTGFVDTLMYWLPCNDNGFGLLSDIVTTPDGRWLAGLDYYGALLALVDLSTDSLAYCRYARTPVVPYGPVCQTRR